MGSSSEGSDGEYDPPPPYANSVRVFEGQEEERDRRERLLEEWRGRLGELPSTILRVTRQVVGWRLEVKLAEQRVMDWQDNREREDDEEWWTEGLIMG